MSHIADHIDLIASVCREWDLAEADMKRAEQIDKDLVIPSVNELRYAGRRLVDAWGMATSTEANSSGELEGLLRDAKFFCLRARHDAIDCSVAAMVANVENMLGEIGYLIVSQCYHDLPKLKSALKKIQLNIVNSRADRGNRDLVYKTISECDFPGLIELHSNLMDCEFAMLKEAEAQKAASEARAEAEKAASAMTAQDRRKNVFFTYGGWILAVVLFVISCGIGLGSWKYPRYWEAASANDRAATVLPAPAGALVGATSPVQHPETSAVSGAGSLLPK